AAGGAEARVVLGGERAGGRDWFGRVGGNAGGVYRLHQEIVAQRVIFSTSFGPNDASKKITLLGSFDLKNHHTKNKRRDTMDRSGSAVWHGSLKEGNGTIS